MKRLESYMTSGFHAEMDPIMIFYLIRLVNSLFEDFPYDMLVFEPTDQGIFQVRLAGYNFETNELDEETIICTILYKFPRTFWWKVDDYTDRYLGTFLFPEDW